MMLIQYINNSTVNIVLWVISRILLITQHSCDPEVDAVRLVLDEWFHQILKSNGDQCAQIGGDRAVNGNSQDNVVDTVVSLIFVE